MTIQRIVRVDLCLVIQEFLVHPTTVDSSRFEREDFYELDLCELTENRRSWVNFLSCRKDINWREVRKATLPITLNRNFSAKYLKDEQFRNFILAKICSPYNQLSLNLYACKIGEFTDSEWSFLSGIHSLNLSSCTFSVLPPLEHVYYIDLGWCYSLNNISDLKDVEILYSPAGPTMDMIGTGLKNSLKELSLANAAESIIEQFPLENLTTLKLVIKVNDAFLSLLEERCGNDHNSLTSLTLFNVGDHVEIAQLPLEKLVQLILRNVTLLDITNLTELKSLTLYEDCKIGSGSISGKTTEKNGKTFRQLRELCGYGSVLKQTDVSRLSNLRAFTYRSMYAETYQHSLQECPNVKKVSFSESQELSQLSYVGPHVQDINLKRTKLIDDACLKGSNDDNGDRSFLRINLVMTPVTDVSFLRNTMKVLLDGCLGLSDISALKDVSYLSLAHCPNIRDFSPLQGDHRRKYLNVSFMPRLTDHDLNYFVNVEFLNISHCVHLTDLSMLKESIYIIADCCHGLEVVNLLGENYRDVSLSSCDALKEIYFREKKVCFSFAGFSAGFHLSNVMLESNYEEYGEN
jgi:hypothetical protein